MKKRQPSRLTPGYLARRHAGMIFMCVALGLLAGMAVRTFLQPTRYRAAASVDVAVVPPEAAADFDWDGQEREWRYLLQSRRDQGLLSLNLRHVVKLAVTQDLLLDTSTLADRLERLAAGEEFTTLLLPYPAARAYVPGIRVDLDSLVENLDAQSLAVIITDTQAPAGVEGWDFSFFQGQPLLAARDGIIVNPGPDDRYFRVFYALASHVNPARQPATPLEAWKRAIRFVTERLRLEQETPGAGGFGHTAMRELVREIVAIPALAANGLYASSDWFPGDHTRDDPVQAWIEQWAAFTTVNLERLNVTGGLVEVSMTQDLYPLQMPRNTILNRIQALATATFLAYLGARERESVAPPVPPVAARPEPTPMVEPVPTPPVETVQVAPRVSPEVQAAVITEVIDDIANQARLSRIGMLEEAVRMAEIERDAALRRLDAGRETENRLSFEAVNARLRADRLEERYERALAESAKDATPHIPDDQAELFERRDAAYKKLLSLLETCTEEHPFVRAARRELDAAEKLLADLSPDARANQEAEARAMRLATLYLEWENAVSTADNLAVRASQQSDDVACLLDEVTQYEMSISRCQMELAEARAEPVPIVRIAVSPPTDMEEPPLTETTVAELPPLPEPEPEPAPAPLPEPEARQDGPRLLLGMTPARIPLEARPPSWRAVQAGAAAGLCLGFIAMLLRELLARRFRDAYEARRLIGLPVLLSLPAYDPKSQRAATRTMKGLLQRTAAGRLQFVPVPVEIEEPPPVARRGSITPKRKMPRLLGWILGLLILCLAGVAYRYSNRPILPPRWPSAPELSLPSATLRAWSEEGDVWGDEP